MWVRVGSSVISVKDVQCLKAPVPVPVRVGGSVISLKGRAPVEGAEGAMSNLGEVRRQRNLTQGRAILEGAMSNLGEVGRQRNLAQGRAILEGAMSNLGEVGQQCNLAQRRALERALSNLDEVGRPIGLSVSLKDVRAPAVQSRRGWVAA